MWLDKNYFHNNPKLYKQIAKNTFSDGKVLFACRPELNARLSRSILGGSQEEVSKSSQCTILSVAASPLFIAYQATAQPLLLPFALSLLHLQMSSFL